jgi:hypothetical protein
VPDSRAEEDRLSQAKAPNLPWRRIENHCLALRLQNLMREAELGFDVGSGRHALFDMWHRYRTSAAAPAPRKSARQQLAGWVRVKLTQEFSPSTSKARAVSVG